MDTNYDMDEGRIAVVTTDNSSRFFKGDRLVILRYIRTTDRYIARRLEGLLEGEINREDVRFEG